MYVACIQHQQAMPFEYGSVVLFRLSTTETGLDSRVSLYTDLQVSFPWNGIVVIQALSPRLDRNRISRTPTWYTMSQPWPFTVWYTRTTVSRLTEPSIRRP
jgi:hypothetical protein